MAQIAMSTNEESFWQDVEHHDFLNLMGDGSPPLRLYLLKSNIEGGKSIVRIRLDLPDGPILLTEVSLANFLHAARIFELADRHGGPRR